MSTIFLFCSCSISHYYPVNTDGSVLFINEYGKKQTEWISGYSSYSGYEVPTIVVDVNTYKYKYYNQKSKDWICVDFFNKGNFPDHIFSDGLLSRKIDKTGVYGYINYQGDWVIEPMYESTSPFSFGVAWVYKKFGDPYLLINKKNEVVFTAEDYMAVTPFVNGYAYVTKQIVPDYYVPYIENGVEIEGAEECISGSFGGIIDENGNEVISFTLGEYSEVSDSVVKCKERYADKHGNTYSLYGYKNLKDEWIINPRFVYADNFKYGFAEVSDDGEKYYLIDKKGAARLQDNFTFIYVLSKDILVVSYNQKDFFLCDLEGTKKSDFFNLIKIIDKNMCLAELNNEKVYINKKGKCFFFNAYK